MTSASRSHPAAALAGTRLGKYEVLTLLARGGTAAIYLARVRGEAGFEKYVVVKCLHHELAADSDFLRMFLDEARLAAQLDHSNIVHTLELGREAGRYFIVMEYLAGMSLWTLARKAKQRVPGGLIPTPLVLGLAYQACAGLHYVHERCASDGAPLRIVHRDVSPQNLVVSFGGVLKIVDFGVAKAERRASGGETGLIEGKFAYMSPEQAAKQPLDRRTDIFALGIVTHELLTGHRLFLRESPAETIRAISSGQVPAPSRLRPELDDAVDAVILRALAARAADRYPSAVELGEAIQRVLQRRGESASPADVERFFSQYFSYEVHQHAAKMQEVVSQRGAPLPRELSWNQAEEEETELVSPPAAVSLATPARGEPGDLALSLGYPGGLGLAAAMAPALRQRDEADTVVANPPPTRAGSAAAGVGSAAPHPASRDGAWWRESPRWTEAAGAQAAPGRSSKSLMAPPVSRGGRERPHPAVRVLFSFVVAAAIGLGVTVLLATLLT